MRKCTRERMRKYVRKSVRKCVCKSVSVRVSAFVRACMRVIVHACAHVYEHAWPSMADGDGSGSAGGYVGRVGWVPHCAWRAVCTTPVRSNVSFCILRRDNAQRTTFMLNGPGSCSTDNVHAQRTGFTTDLCRISGANSARTTISPTCRTKSCHATWFMLPTSRSTSAISITSVIAQTIICSHLTR